MARLEIRKSIATFARGTSSGTFTMEDPPVGSTQELNEKPVGYTRRTAGRVHIWALAGPIKWPMMCAVPEIKQRQNPREQKSNKAISYPLLIRIQSTKLNIIQTNLYMLFQFEVEIKFKINLGRMSSMFVFVHE